MSDLDLDALWAAAEAKRQSDEDLLAPLLRRMYDSQRMAVLSTLSTIAASADYLRLEAMALDMPDVPGHPNRRPFKGILTRVGEPSDKAPHGSSNRRVLITLDAAKEAIPSLLGMAINYVPSLDNHDRQRKIGLITEADVSGNAIVIGGFFYADDFPREVAEIVRNQRQMGFSFDTGPFAVEDPNADPWVITHVVFTGAAVLRKDKAAYTSTALAAAAASNGEDAEMSEAIDKLMAKLDEIDKSTKDALAAQAAEIKTLKAGGLSGNAAVIGMVKPHADSLHTCADGMMAAGIGCDANNGHGAVLKRMASHMMSAAAQGQMPHIFRDHDYPMGGAAAASNGGDDVKAEEVTKMIQAAVAPLADKLAAAETVNADLKAKLDKLQAGAAAGGDGGGADGGQAQRKTISAAATSLLNKFALEADGEGKISAGKITEAMKKSGATPEQIMATKAALNKEGALTA